MDDSLEKGNGSEGVAETSPARDPLGELRRLLLAAGETQVSRLQERLDDPEIHAEDVSRVLPEAIVIRAAKDHEVTRVLLPTVEEAIVTSVRRNPQVLVDALFPVMGPAIRKAISSALASMLESFNETLERSFSIQGLKWRLEAWRTGKPLAEVILLRTLAYRVEQVFLIHRKSGLLLEHVSATGAGVQDADMVSGMLTAIRDFVHDSFGGKEGDSLDTFQVGELSVCVEQGPQAALAAVVRGNGPKELRSVFTEAIEKIHLEEAAELDAFDGDATPFERSRPHLEACLKGERQRKAERAPGARNRRAIQFLRAAVVVLVVGLGLWAVAADRRNRRWEAYLGRLSSEPGIVVTETGRRGGRYFVTGLRDPLAADPVKLLEGSKLPAEKVTSDWKPYYALAPQFVAARARYVLEPPDTVKLEAREGTLVAAGSAPNRWIEEARARSRAIPGITRYDDSALTDEDSADLQSLSRRIEGRVLLFTRGSAELSPAEAVKLHDTVGDVKNLASLAASLGRTVRVEVIGRGDSLGSEEVNLVLSRRRAERVAAALGPEGLGALTLVPTGVGSARPLRPELTERDRDANRSVSFHVVVEDARDKIPARR